MEKEQEYKDLLIKCADLVNGYEEDEDPKTLYRRCASISSCLSDFIKDNFPNE